MRISRIIQSIILFAVIGSLLMYEYGAELTLKVGGCSIFLFVLLRIKFWHSRKKNYLNSHFEQIDRMTGIEFEQYLKYQFSRLHYKVKMTPESGDFGADLLLTRRNELYVVQAKRYSGAVGIKAVQEVIGAIDYYGADGGMVVTNSYYTKAAKELAEASGIILWDRRDLEEEFPMEKRDIRRYKRQK